MAIDTADTAIGTRCRLANHSILIPNLSFSATSVVGFSGITDSPALALMCLILSQFSRTRLSNRSNSPSDQA